MALTRAQLLAGNTSQGVVLPGQVQGVTAGPGVTINSSGVLALNGTDPAFNGFVKTNNAAAFNAFIWPAADGSPGQQLTTNGAGTLIWSDWDGIPWTTKGQLIIGTGSNTDALLPVGTDGSILTANSASATGLGYTSLYVATTAASGSAKLPVGDTAARDGSPAQGYLRFNSDSKSLEVYDGVTWVEAGNLAAGLGTAIVNDTIKATTSTSSLPPAVGALPAQAIDGSMYWDDNLGALFIYYNDGTSSQWVQAIPS